MNHISLISRPRCYAKSPTAQDTFICYWFWQCTVSQLLLKTLVFRGSWNTQQFDISLLFIGASLSNPHTSATALQKCVCILTSLFACLQPYTINFKRSALYFRKLNEHPWPDSLVPSTPSVKDYTRMQRRCERNSEWRRLKLMHAWQLRNVTDKGRLRTRRYKSRAV